MNPPFTILTSPRGRSNSLSRRGHPLPTAEARFDYLLNRLEAESQILQRQIQNLGRTHDLLLSRQVELENEEVQA